MHEVDEQRLTKVLEGTPGLIGAWVFGSARDLHPRQGSDLDLGLLFADPPSLEELLAHRARLQLALGFEEIDLVPLNDGSPVLRFEALCGRRMLCRDEVVIAEFASLAAREYEDEMGQLQSALNRP
jgi:predicted nucleotidyltransferase